MLEPETQGRVLGLRIGEALGCLHSDETALGCGTTVFCAECGAARSQVVAAQGNNACQECRIIRRQAGDDLDLRVWARPVTVGGERFTIMTLLDISNEKRREVLERIFFHDILNTAGALRGASSLFSVSVGADREEMAEVVEHLSDLLIDEIEAQRELMAMERGTFRLELRDISAEELIVEVAETLRHHEVATGRVVRLGTCPQDPRLRTDPRLLRRVLTNMTKNALEACPAGGTVTMACTAAGDRVTFSVHNPAVMPEFVQLQVFQRSFSTKGAGRGLGTYSMKLITERYLQGQITFESTAEGGTTFFAEYPRAVATPP
jgi:signal transduction histidine kinase